LIILLSLIATLTGCYSITYQRFDKGANRNIKKIAVLQVREPKSLVVGNVPDALARSMLDSTLGPPSGDFFAGVAQQTMNTSFTDAMVAQDLGVGRVLTTTIEEELRHQGYDVIVATNRPGVSDPTRDDQEVNYSYVNPDADAILHVWFTNVGYFWFADSKSYSPMVDVVGRLVKTEDKSQIYCQPYINKRTRGEYEFADYDALMASSSSAANGIRQGAWDIGILIAAELGGSDPADRARVVARARDRRESSKKTNKGAAASAPSADATSTEGGAPPPSSEAPPEAAKPFNHEAAASGLSAAAANAGTCRTNTGPKGSGQVKVTFAPTGKVKTVLLISGPFSGTTEGVCISAQFRAIAVPPFEGPPVSLVESVTIK
jgi:hypothetical protein